MGSIAAWWTASAPAPPPHINTAGEVQYHQSGISIQHQGGRELTVMSQGFVLLQGSCMLMPSGYCSTAQAGSLSAASAGGNRQAGRGPRMTGTANAQQCIWLVYGNAQAHRHVLFKHGHHVGVVAACTHTMCAWWRQASARTHAESLSPRLTV